MKYGSSSSDQQIIGVNDQNPDKHDSQSIKSKQSSMRNQMISPAMDVKSQSKSQSKQSSFRNQMMSPDMVKSPDGHKFGLGNQFD